MTTWRVWREELEPGAVGFAYARMALRVRSRTERRVKGAWVAGEWQDRMFVGSAEAESRSAEGWLRVVRGHWAGVEIRNHWQKDASLREDQTRSRHPVIVSHLMLLRNVVLWYRVREEEAYPSFPAFVEAMAAQPRHVFRLVTRAQR